MPMRTKFSHSKIDDARTSHRCAHRISLYRLCVDFAGDELSFAMKKKRSLFTIYLFSHRKSFRFVRCVNNRGIRLTRTLHHTHKHSQSRTRTPIVENEFHKALSRRRATSTLLIIIDTAPQQTPTYSSNNEWNYFISSIFSLLFFDGFLSFRIYFRLSEIGGLAQVLRIH